VSSEPLFDSLGDSEQPTCQVALCGRPANYRATDHDEIMVYVCEAHRPWIGRMSRPPGAITESRYFGPSR
jgi:hypothetical protein